MRVIITARQSLTPVHEAVLTRLVNILGEISKNPSNPKFNQYCFESVSALIRFVCEGTPEALPKFEQAIFGPAQVILSQDVAGGSLPIHVAGIRTLTSRIHPVHLSDSGAAARAAPGRQSAARIPSTAAASALCSTLGAARQHSGSHAYLESSAGPRWTPHCIKWTSARPFGHLPASSRVKERRCLCF